MTPTPEEIALAKDVAKELLSDGRMGYYGISYEAALTAIMKVREKAAELCAKRGAEFTACAIRNGEHLR